VLHSPHAKTGRQLSAGQHVRPFGVISRLAHLAQLGEDASSSMVSVLCCAVLCCAVLCCASCCIWPFYQDSVTCPAAAGAQSTHRTGWREPVLYQMMVPGAASCTAF